METLNLEIHETPVPALEAARREYEACPFELLAAKVATLEAQQMTACQHQPSSK